MDDALEFGQWLKRRRRGLDWTQAQLAERARCSTATIKKIEAGDLQPSRQLAALIAEAVGVPASERAAFIAFARSTDAAVSAAAFRSRQPSVPAVPAPAPPPPPSYALPAQMNAVIGREHEIAAVRALLRQTHVRLLTLTGPPGTGKTRLSLAVAAAMEDELVDRACFVPLAPISDSGLVLPAIASALGVSEVPRQPLATTVQAFLRTRELLLALDNFEQVLAAAATIRDLLEAAPGLKVLVSSREALQLYGEQEFPVPPLGFPTVERAASREALLRYPAIELFEQRARAVNPAWQLDDRNASAVAAICAALDGLPLAIEMAAARVKWTPPAQLLEQLRARLATLVGGPRDLTPRQQTLRGAIDWSYDLLEPALRRSFGALGVFAGSASPAALAAVICEAEPIVLARLQGLAEKSLARYVVDADGSPRFTMLLTIREYALEKLAESGARAEAHRRHAVYFCELAEAAATQLLGGAGQLQWLRRVEDELPNFRAALAWAVDEGADPELGLRLADALYLPLQQRAMYAEGRRWLESALAHVPTPSVLRGRALSRLGVFLYRQGDLAQGAALQQAALAIQEQLADLPGISRSLQNLAIIAGMQDDIVRARDLLERSLALERAADNRPAIATVLLNLAIVAQRQEDYERAEQLLTENIELRVELEDQINMPTSLHTLGTVLRRLGKHEQARAVLGQSLLLRHQLHNLLGVASSLEPLAALIAPHDASAAARLMGAASALRESMGAPLSPDARVIHDQDVAAIAARLAPDELTAAWSAGRAMALDDVVALALRFS